MKIKRIKLSNFRQFHGNDNIIEFSTDENKNVTLIHAENGVGKTTLLNSILWCFYEKFTDDFEQKTNIVNIDAKMKGVTECEVEVEFIHEGKTYSALRRYFTKTEKSKIDVFVVEGGSYQPIKNDKLLLNSVIPKEMAEYFLFHGEGISKLQANASSFRNAIRDILGFTLAEQALKDLAYIERKWDGQLQKINAHIKKFAKTSAELDALNLDVTSKRANLQVVSDQISDLNAQKRSIDEQILNCKIVDVTDIKKRLNATEARIKNRKDELSKCHVGRQRMIGVYGWKIFGVELSEKSLDFIDTTTLTGKIPAPYDETLVNDIISSEQCICGRCIKKGTHEYNVISALVDRANTTEIKSNIMKARSFAQTIGNGAQQFIDEYNQNSHNIKKINNELANLLEEKKELLDALDDIDDSRLKELRSKEENISYALSRAELSLKSLSNEINLCEVRINALTNEKNKVMPRNSESFKIQQSIYFVKKLMNLCRDKLNVTENESKLIIASDVNKILTNFSRKDYSVKVSDNFNFELVREGGEVVAKSKGEKLLLNLAFVSALIQMASKRSKAEGRFLQPGTVAPFIIDAPFGELDETYRKATAHFLPENAEQLVLLLSSSHWLGAVGDAIKDRVGNEYVLVSHKKATRGNKPLDEIMIDEKVFQQSIYDSKFDGTSICRIK